MGTVIASVSDPERRRVVLDVMAWEHIVGAHPLMEGHERTVVAAVRSPDHREPDPRPGRERFFAQGLGPRAWLRVVVDFTTEPAYVVTAFPEDRAPAAWTSR